MFSDILMTVDFDRTLTGPDGKIPQRNLEAIHYFMDNGGSFTVNTGRSTNTFGRYLRTLPANAPFLLYNGSAAWQDGELVNIKPIDLPMWETLHQVQDAFPDLNLEIQAADNHYLLNVQPEYVEFYDAMGWNHKTAMEGTDLGPFMKFSLFGTPRAMTVADFYRYTPQEHARFAEAVEFLQTHYGDKVEVFLAAPRIIDVHAKGVSKLAAARQLQKDLGKKHLVCVGDAENDIPMLDGADFAFCPGDAVVAHRYPNVCNCGEGAVADVIYKKIPEILNIKP